MKTENDPKVLLFITDGSRDLELMLTEEVMLMKEILEQASFEVVITTISCEPISAGSVRIDPDLKLNDVNITDYAGFIFPCMAPPVETITNLNPDLVSFVKRISNQGKPLAAQTFSIVPLADAGILVNKKYAFTFEPDLEMLPGFSGGIYSGEGVVQDGNIITSGTCPWKTRAFGKPHGTKKLTQLLIHAIAKN
jgi:putative intracellular protease/amidase